MKMKCANKNETSMECKCSIYGLCKRSSENEWNRHEDHMSRCTESRKSPTEQIQNHRRIGGRRQKGGQAANHSPSGRESNRSHNRQVGV